MIFKFILNNAEPFALNLQAHPWRISVRAQVILGFVALGLGKGGLFISTFLAAMAWSEDGWLIYAILGSFVTLVVMAFGYLITFGRIAAEIDKDADRVHLTKRIPFRRQTVTEPLSNYQGIALKTHTDRDNRTTHTLMLIHQNADLNIPLWQRRRPEQPSDEWSTYADALGVTHLRR